MFTKKIAIESPKSNNRPLKIIGALLLGLAISIFGIKNCVNVNQPKTTPKVEETSSNIVKPSTTIKNQVRQTTTQIKQKNNSIPERKITQKPKEFEDINTDDSSSQTSTKTTDFERINE